MSDLNTNLSITQQDLSDTSITDNDCGLSTINGMPCREKLMADEARRELQEKIGLSSEDVIVVPNFPDKRKHRRRRASDVSFKVKFALHGTTHEYDLNHAGDCLTPAFFFFVLNIFNVVKRVTDFDYILAMQSMILHAATQINRDSITTFKGIFDLCHIGIGCKIRNFRERLNSHDFERAMAALATVAISVSYYQSVWVSEQPKSKSGKGQNNQAIDGGLHSALRTFLNRHGFRDLYVIDGCNVAVNSAMNAHTNVSAAGPQRKASVKKGDSRENKQGRPNASIKCHVLLSALHETMLYINITGGLASEHDQLDVNVIKKITKDAIVLADRNYAATREYLRLNMSGDAYIIRMPAGNRNTILYAATSKGDRLYGLEGKKVSDDLVTIAADKLGPIDLVVDVRSKYDKSKLTIEELKLCEPANVPDQKKYWITVGGVRMTVIKKAAKLAPYHIDDIPHIEGEETACNFDAENFIYDSLSGLKPVLNYPDKDSVDVDDIYLEALRYFGAPAEEAGPCPFALPLLEGSYEDGDEQNVDPEAIIKDFGEEYDIQTILAGGKGCEEDGPAVEADTGATAVRKYTKHPRSYNREVADARLIYLATNIGIDVMRAEFIAELYKFRWPIETENKMMKQYHSLHRSNKQITSGVLCLFYASIIASATASITGNHISVMLNEREDCTFTYDDLKRVVSHESAARDGITRRAFEIKSLVKHLSALMNGVEMKSMICPDCLKLSTPVEPGINRERMSYLTYSKDFVERLNSSPHHGKEILQSCSPTELDTMIDGAAIGIPYFVRMVEEVDAFLSSEGIESEIMEVLKVLKSRCISLGINILDAIKKPKIPDVISMFCTHKYNRNGNIFREIFKDSPSYLQLANGQIPDSYWESRTQTTDVFEQYAADLYDSAKAYHMSLRTYERGKDNRLHACRLLYQSLTMRCAVNLPPEEVKICPRGSFIGRRF